MNAGRVDPRLLLRAARYGTVGCLLGLGAATGAHSLWGLAVPALAGAVALVAADGHGFTARIRGGAR